MPKFRSFIAINLPPEVTDSLHKATNQLIKSGISGVRWIAVQNMHLTLKFLGEISQQEQLAVVQFLEQETAKHQAFDLQVKGLGVFPDIHRARIIWAGIQSNPDLARLFNSLEHGLKDLGFQPENREFSPHLTLGRVRREAGKFDLASIEAALSNPDIHLKPSMLQVKSIHLFRSDLNPAGAVYTRQATAHLAFVA